MSERLPNNSKRNTVIGVLIAIGISTLGIQASDYIEYGTSSFLASLGDRSACPEYSVLLTIDGQPLCVDVFEASAASVCPFSEPRSAADNTANIQTTDCRAVSAPEVQPLRFTTYTHAEQFCARAGKRLPTPREWHVLARDVAVDPENCVVRGGLQETGSADCVSGAGVHDLVGNVWEWVDAEIVDGRYNGRAVPPSGYVHGVDTAGVVLETGEEPDPLYDGAYAWTSNEGVHGMVRGGFYGSGDDAGRYAQNLSVSLDTATAGIGFRCVMDARGL